MNLEPYTLASQVDSVAFPISAANVEFIDSFHQLVQYITSRVFSILLVFLGRPMSVSSRKMHGISVVVRAAPLVVITIVGCEGGACVRCEGGAGVRCEGGAGVGCEGGEMNLSLCNAVWTFLRSVSMSRVSNTNRLNFVEFNVVVVTSR